MAEVTEADVLAYLKREAPEIAALISKDVTVGDVHATTAIGNDKENSKPKGKPFAALIAQAAAARGKKPGDDEPTEKSWDLPLDIVKAQPDQQLIFGWASMSEKDGKLIVDKQGDQITPAELEKAAYDFVLNSRVQGDMHVKKGTGRLVESFVFTKQKQDLLGIDLGCVGWWCGFKVDDAELWAQHRAGNRPEFSIGGRAVRAPAEAE